MPMWFPAFLALLVLLPLPLGAVPLWAGDALGAACGVLLLGMAVALRRQPEGGLAGAPVKRLGVSAGLFALVALWGFAQGQSWMPGAWHHPLWHEMPSPFAAIALQPEAVPEALLRMLSYAACFLLAFFGGREREQAWRMVLVLAAAGVVYALYGLLMQATGLKLVLWYDKTAYRDFVTSTYVNKNSYATYAALGLLCSLALLARKLNGAERGLEGLVRAALVPGLMALILLGALLMTGSRAGIASGVAGAAVFALAWAINKGWRWRVAGLLALGSFVVVGGLLMVSASSFLDRMGTNELESAAPLRFNAYATTLRAIAASPWQGVGLGGFEAAFRLHRDASVPLWFQHAHNDYLEMGLELGTPAALLLLVALLLPVTCCAQGVLRRRRDGALPALAVAASVTVGLHSLADFSLQIPAVAATYAALLGMGTAQSWSSRVTPPLSAP